MCSSAFLSEPQSPAKRGPANVWQLEHQEWTLTSQCVPVRKERLYAGVQRCDVVPAWMVGRMARLHWPGYFADSIVVAAEPVEVADRPEPHVELELCPAEMGYAMP